MAKGSDHIKGGVITWFLCLYFLRTYVDSLEITLLWLICSVAGSLFPDLDIKSRGQRFFYGLMAPAYALLYFYGEHTVAFMVGLCAFLPAMTVHRGILHRWWFIFLFAGLWGFGLASRYPCGAHMIHTATVCFIVGALSHLVLDFGIWRVFFDM